MSDKVIQVEDLVKEVTPIQAPAGLQSDRVTMTLNIVHQPVGEEPHSINFVGSELLKLGEELYTKRVIVDKEWQPIPLGHLQPDQVGRICIQNLEGLKGRLSQPTEAERQAIQSRVVELAYSHSSELDYSPNWLIEPGWPFTGRPDNSACLYLRCINGPAKCRVTLYPK